MREMTPDKRINMIKLAMMGKQRCEKGGVRSQG